MKVSVEKLAQVAKITVICKNETIRILLDVPLVGETDYAMCELHPVPVDKTIFENRIRKAQEAHQSTKCHNTKLVKTNCYATLGRKLCSSAKSKFRTPISPIGDLSDLWRDRCTPLQP